MTATVLLLNPKYPHNVGSALRACALLGAETLSWTGDRVPAPNEWPEGARLPREERLRCYKRTLLQWIAPGSHLLPAEVVPVCIEITNTAVNLAVFDHPPNATYVFGPEDGGVPQSVRKLCHRFVRIPNAIPEDDPDSRTPYNLAAAVNIVLWDRLFKQREGESRSASQE